MLVIQPLAVVLAAPVFVLVIVLTRYVSLGSLLGSAVMFPVMLLLLLVVPETPLPYVIYSAVGAALIWLAHADNIDRLIHGTERKFDLGCLAAAKPRESADHAVRPADARSRASSRSRGDGRPPPQLGHRLGGPSASRWTMRWLTPSAS